MVKAKQKGATAPKLGFLWKKKRKKKKKDKRSVFFQIHQLNALQRESLKTATKMVLGVYQQLYSHIFPFFCISHNLTASYESCGSYEVSWDVPVHNSSFQYHLKQKRRKLNNRDNSFLMKNLKFMYVKHQKAFTTEAKFH